MTREQKLKAIADMDVDIDIHCPMYHALQDHCAGNSCESCWIQALEENPNDKT